jgi:hypothetical protein
MKTIRYIAAGLLLLTATFHVAQIALTPLDVTLIVTVAFGAAYLAIGAFLFRDGQVACYLGALVPLAGLALAAIGMLTRPTLLGAFFIAMDVVIVGCCVYLLFQGRPGAQARR